MSKKTTAQLEREIQNALRFCPAKCKHKHRHKLHHLTQSEAEPTADELYMVAYDVLREYESYKKAKQEKTPEAKELAKRFNRIRKEAKAKYPDAKPPEQFAKLYEKLTKPDKTYPQAQRDILDNLAANGWQVSAALKIPHATSPNGRLRLWFKPQAVWFTKMGSSGERSQFGGTHNFKDARTMSYDLDIRTQDPDTFRGWAVRSSEK